MGDHADIDHSGLTGVGLGDPMTTRGDVIVRNASNVTARLAVGSSGKVLSSDGTDVSWQTPSAGFSDPMTTRGDIIIRNSSNATARLGRGTATYVLTSDGTDVAWAAPSTGGGVTVPTLLAGTSSTGLNTTNPAVTIPALASGSSVIVGINFVGRGATSVTCTNCTFTKMAGVQNGAGSYYEIWAASATGTTGTTLTVNTGSSNFASICVLGVSNTLTPTAGTVTSGSIVGQITLPVTRTAGRFVAYLMGADNTINPMYFVSGVPGHMTNYPGSGGGTALWVGFAPTAGTLGGQLIAAASSTPFVVAVDIT